jgi:hypothetical protein
MTKRRINCPKTTRGQIRKALTCDGRKTIKRRK